MLAHSDVALAVTHTGMRLMCARCAVRARRRSVALHVAAEGGAISRRGSGRRPRARDEAALLYTSGTTGTPKGCILTNEYFLEIGRLYTGLGGYCRFDAAGDRLATPLPVTHMNALAVSFMAMLMTGGCLIQLDRFHPSTWWHSIRASRATAFHYLGVMPAMLLKAPPSADDNFAGRLRFGFGAGVDPRHHAAFEARFGVPLIEAWAMTETGAGAWITANQRAAARGPALLRQGAARVWPIASSMTRGDDVAPGAVGELLVRRDGADPRRGFFSGYYKDARGDRAGLGRRLVSYRRSGAGRRGRILLLRRSLEERGSAQRREHRGGRSRKRAADPPRRSGSRPSVR